MLRLASYIVITVFDLRMRSMSGPTMKCRLQIVRTDLDELQRQQQLHRSRSYHRHHSVRAGVAVRDAVHLVDTGRKVVEVGHAGRIRLHQKYAQQPS